MVVDDNIMIVGHDHMVFGVYQNVFHNIDNIQSLCSLFLRAGLDLESRLKNGLGWKKSTPLIGREAGTHLFKFTPWVGAN